MPSDQLRICIFGGLRARHDGRELNLGVLRARILLAELVVARGKPVGVARLIDALWNDAPPASARNQLHRHLGQLRRALEPGLRLRERGSAIEPDGAGYRLHTRVSSDLDELDELLQSARLLREAGGSKVTGCGASHDALPRIVRLCLGAPFADLPLHVQQRPEFRVVFERRTAATAEALSYATGAGSAQDLLETCEEIAASAPLDEPLHAALIEALVVSGRQARAAVVFEGLRERLDQELGVSPSFAVRSAYAKSHQAAGGTPTAAADRLALQLPPVVRGFVDRSDILRQLDAGLAHPESAVRIAVLSGMGGIGKTALAVRWARSVSHEFPDGQFHINLRGFDPAEDPVSPMEALTTLLTAFDVHPIATNSIDARSAQLRAVLEQRKAFLLLDNAGSSDQVRPLLPGSPSCVVVVTSRAVLAGLVAREGAVPIHVDRLPEGSAIELLRARLGKDRVDPNNPDVKVVTKSCAGHPLALSMIAAQVATTNRSIADVAQQLGKDRVLDALSIDEAGEDLRLEFERSARAVSPQAQRMFRLLVVHPGPDISPREMASISGLPVSTATRICRELVSANLVAEAAGGRLTYHDLLAAYAQELLSDPAERAEAEQRLIDHTAATVRNCQLVHGWHPVAAHTPPSNALCPEEPSSVAEVSQWYALHRTTLAAVIRLACQTGRERQAALLTLDRWVLSEFREARSDNLALVLSVIQATALLPEAALRAELQRYAGCILQQLGQREESRKHLKRALRLYQSIGDLAGCAETLGSMSTEGLGGADLASSLAIASDAVQLARISGKLWVLVKTLGLHALMLIHAGRWDECRAVACEGLSLPIDEVNARQLRFVLLAALGQAELGTGNIEAARQIAQDALQVTGDMDAGRQLWLWNVLGEACILEKDYSSALTAYDRWHVVRAQLPPADVFPMGLVNECFAVRYEATLVRTTAGWRDRLAAADVHATT